MKPDPKLSHAGNFLHMLFGKKPTAEDEHILDVAFVLHADHDMNASTFAARVTCATLSDMYSAVTSAVGTLKGPLHGGANQQVMETFLRLGDVTQNVEPYVKQQLAKKEKVAGFGHRVYRTTDPRAPLLAEFSAGLAKRAGETRWYEMTKKLEDVMVREKQLYPNVDLWSASVFYMLKVPGRPVQRALRDRPDVRVDGPRPRAVLGQPPDPPPGRVSGRTRSEVGAGRQTVEAADPTGRCGSAHSLRLPAPRRPPETSRAPV